jgi:uncharacterized protein YjbJ (UPF0337 family)
VNRHGGAGAISARPRRCPPKEIDMNWDRIEGNWKQFKGKAKQKWGELTDDDLDKLAGKKDQLIGKIQERKGIERDRAEREVNEWMNSL